MLNYVLQKSDKKVLRYGVRDFEMLGPFDYETEEQIQSPKIPDLPVQEELYWNATTEEFQATAP